MVRIKNTGSVGPRVASDYGMGTPSTGTPGKKALKPRFTEQYRKMKKDETKASRTDLRTIKDTLKYAEEAMREKNVRKAREREETRDADGRLEEAMELFHMTKGLDTDGHKLLHEEAVKESCMRDYEGRVYKAMWANGERKAMQIEDCVGSDDDVDAVVQQVKGLSDSGSERVQDNEIRESIEKPVGTVINDAGHPSEGEDESPGSAAVAKGEAKGNKGGYFKRVPYKKRKKCQSAERVEETDDED